MDFLKFIYYTFFNYIIYNILLSHKIVSFAVYLPLKREIRFTKVNSKFVNNFSGIVLDTSYKQYDTTQALFYHFKINKIITDFSVRFSVNKCKEYHIDCINVVSYDISNGCSKLNLITYFQLVNDLKDTVQKCPIFGEYIYRNVSIHTDKFMSSFSNPTEKWWEYSWKIKSQFFNESNIEFFTSTADFYFIQFRIRNRKT